MHSRWCLFTLSVTANRYERKLSHLSCKKSTNCTLVGFMLIAVKSTFWKYVLFKKGHPHQKGGCADTLDTPLDPPLITEVTRMATPMTTVRLGRRAGVEISDVNKDDKPQRQMPRVHNVQYTVCEKHQRSRPFITRSRASWTCRSDSASNALTYHKTHQLVNNYTVITRLKYTEIYQSNLLFWYT